MKARWFNYRPLCLVFIFLLLGSIFSYFIINQLVLTIILTLLCLSVLLIFSFKNKTLKYILIAFFSFLVGIIGYNVAILSFNQTATKTPTQITARISMVSQSKDCYLYVYADNLQFDGKNINDNIIISIKDSSNLFTDLEVGRYITFTPDSLSHTSIYSDNGVNAKYFYKDLKYTASTNVDNITLGKIDYTLAESIKQQIKENSFNGLSYENAELLYSSMFGEKQDLSTSTYSAYQIAGIAHLLAVSGLHVGIIIGFIGYILNKLRVKPIVNLIICSIILFVYAYLCSFAVSVVRASIMSICLLLAPICHRRYDSLSALGLAGIIIFLFYPLCAFDVSMIMSFASVFGIVVLYYSIITVLEKVNLNNKITQSLAISLSANIYLFMIMAYYFGTINFVAIFANIIIIPIFTVCFIAYFGVAVLSLICPYFAYILFPFNYVLNFMNIITVMFSSLPYANLQVDDIGILAILLYAILIAMVSRICVNKKYKWIFILLILAILVLSLL